MKGEAETGKGTIRTGRKKRHAARPENVTVFKTLNSRSLPSAFSWSVAFISVLGLTVGCLVLQIFFEGLTQLLAYKDFESNVYLTQSDSSIDARLDSIVEMKDSLLVRTVQTTFMDIAPKKNEERMTIVGLMREILREIKSGRYSDALTIYDHLIEQWRNNVVAGLGGDAYASNIVLELRDEFIFADKTKKTIRRYRAQLEEDDNMLKSILARYRIFAAEFSNFLSLKPAEAKNPQEPLPVYRKGVLKGLPQLARLRDNLHSLKALKKELFILKGRVNIKGGNVYERFTAELNRQRDNVAGLIGEQNAVFKRRTKITEGLNSARLHLQESKRTCLLLSMKIILSQTKPQLGVFSEDLYRKISGLYNKFEFLPNLPEI